jgi:hypothetical protein
MLLHAAAKTCRWTVLLGLAGWSDSNEAGRTAQQYKILAQFNLSFETASIVAA